MIKGDYYIKFQACNLCDSLHRNINDNFKSVSFEILENGNIQTKIVLRKMTQVEENFIEDISVEFSSKQQKDCILKPIVEIGSNITPLENIVYQQK